jgi:hypothetical protein
MKTMSRLAERLLDFAETRMPIPTVAGWVLIVSATCCIAAYWMGIR